MKENDGKSFLNNLKKNVYSNFKTRILPVVLHSEFKMLLNFLKNTKISKTFF